MRIFGWISFIVLSLFGVVLLLGLAAPGNFREGQTVTAWVTFFGCPFEFQSQKLQSLYDQNDADAGTKYSIASNCQWFSPNERFMVQRTSYDWVCIRKRGDPNCYWAKEDRFNRNR